MGRIRALLRKYSVESWLVLGGLAICLVFACSEWIVLGAGNAPNYTGLLGVPLDDVYIHCRFAYNLLHGFGFSFNPPAIVTADTSPLWVALLTIVGSFSPHIEIVAIIISIASYLVLAPGVYRIARDLLMLSEANAQLAGWATVLTSRLIWSAMSGMETALATLLLLLAVEAHIRAYRNKRISSKEALWIALGLLTRPEFYLVAFIFICHWIYVCIREEIEWKGAFTSLILLLAISSPAFLLPLLTRGSFISHSANVQGASVNGAPDLSYILFALKTLIEPNFVVLLLAVAGIAIIRKRSDTIPIVMIVCIWPLAQAIFAPQVRHHGRYLFPLYPLIILLATMGWQDLSERLQLNTKRLISVFAVIAALLSTSRWSYLTASDVRNINDQHLAAAHWLHEHERASDTIAAGDVGAIGYFTGQNIIDLTGLVTPSMWRLQPDPLWRTTRAMGANLFILYPRWNRAFFGRYKDSLELQASFPVRLPLTASADTFLNIYRVKAHQSGS